MIQDRAAVDLDPHGSVPLVNCLDCPALVLPEHGLDDLPLKMALAELVINT